MLRFLLNTKKGLIKFLEWLLIATVALLVLDVVWGVFTRKVLSAQADFTEELAKILMVWVSLLGGAVAFGIKGHLGVDCFVNLFSPKAKKLLAVTVHLVVLIFAILIFEVGGWKVVLEQLQMEQLTPALGWKMGHVYLALPIAGFFILVFTLENLVQTIRGTEETN